MMTTETTTEITRQRSRRSLLAAAVAGTAAAVAASVGRFAPAAAADGDNVKIGENNEGSKTTTVTTQNNAAGIQGQSGTGAGVHGDSMSGAGVKATSDAGHGVNASSMQSYAIATEEGGILLGGISGVATIAAGDTQKSIEPQWATEQSFLVISPRANIESRALWWEHNNDDGFTIHMSSARQNDTHVGWVVIDHSS